MSATNVPARRVRGEDAAPRRDTCRCSHTAEAHRHYRKGSDCALCDCPQYRRTFAADVAADIRERIGDTVAAFRAAFLVGLLLVLAQPLGVWLYHQSLLAGAR